MAKTAKTPLAVRLFSKVEKTDGCWLWRGAMDGAGYGMIFIAKTPRHITNKTHRVSWELANGPIPNKLFVLHRCDTPACLRPDHLFLGTQAENIRDMVSKGRQARIKPKGEVHGMSKLTDPIVRAILANKTASGVALAEVYNVSPSTISLVRKRRIWRHVNVDS